jgi:hypothetical protein
LFLCPQVYQLVSWVFLGLFFRHSWYVTIPLLSPVLISCPPFGWIPVLTAFLKAFIPVRSFVSKASSRVSSKYMRIVLKLICKSLLQFPIIDLHPLCWIM